MPQSPLSFNLKNPTTGAMEPFLADKQQSALFSQFHGSKYHSAYLSALFWAANSAAGTTSSGLTTTYVGICVSNPAGSTVNVILRRASYSLVVSSSCGVGLITGYAVGGVTAHTVALTPAASLINSAATPVAKADSSATLVGTPAWTQFFGAFSSAVGTGTVDFEGGIILPPGAYAAIGTTAASGSSAFWGAFEWQEYPV